MKVQRTSHPCRRRALIKFFYVYFSSTRLLSCWDALLQLIFSLEICAQSKAITSPSQTLILSMPTLMETPNLYSFLKRQVSACYSRLYLSLAINMKVATSVIRHYLLFFFDWLSLPMPLSLNQLNHKCISQISIHDPYVNMPSINVSCNMTYPQH